MNAKKLDTLANFIWEQRRLCGRSWWIGYADKLDDPEEPLLEKLRGWYGDSRNFHLFAAEKCPDCSRIKSKKLIAHGQEMGHIRGMLALQSDKQLETDYEHAKRLLREQSDKFLGGGEDT